MANLMMMGQGLYANYNALQSKSQYEVYFTTDTHQIFVGSEEYTKSTKTLAANPTEDVAGDIGRLYFYNNTLYLCQAVSGEGKYTWTRVANISDTTGTLTSITVGEGLTTTSGATEITASDEIKHAVPGGASVVADTLNDETPDFGDSFNVVGVATDKFGHVTAATTHSVTLPTQTPVGIDTEAESPVTLDDGQAFTVVTSVIKSAEDDATDHDIVYKTTTFTLPGDNGRSYEISSIAEGEVTLTDDLGVTSKATINGWSNLAKKSEISSVFKFKGTVATVAELPATEDVVTGYVYHVTTGASGASAEYVAITDGPNPTWEELGSTIDLSSYATQTYVDEKLTWHEF